MGVSASGLAHLNVKFLVGSKWSNGPLVPGAPLNESAKRPRTEKSLARVEGCAGGEGTLVAEGAQPEAPWS